MTGREAVSPARAGKALAITARKQPPTLTQPETPSGHLQVATMATADGLAGAKLLGHGSNTPALPGHRATALALRCRAPGIRRVFSLSQSVLTLHGCFLLPSSFPVFGNSHSPHTCCMGQSPSLSSRASSVVSGPNVDERQPGASVKCPCSSSWAHREGLGWKMRFSKIRLYHNFASLTYFFHV